jgi:hypothetical protein
MLSLKLSQRLVDHEILLRGELQDLSSHGFFQQPDLRRHLERGDGSLLVAFEGGFDLTKHDALEIFGTRLVRSPSRTVTGEVNASRMMVFMFLECLGRPRGLPDVPFLNRDPAGGRP